MARQLVDFQLNAVKECARMFLENPDAERYEELDSNVRRLGSAMRVQAVVNAFDLESTPSVVVAEWEGGGGGFSGGGASGGW